MSIPVAYCVEASRTVDIAEAQTLYFAQSPPRRALRFLCPDETCRLEFKPEITGINYKKIPGQDWFVQRPHFRINPKHAHHSACPWSEISEAFTQIEKEMSEKTEVIQVFNPLGAEDDASEQRLPDDIIGKIRKLSSREERIQAFKDYISRNRSRTSRLYTVVCHYRAMTDEERQTTPLRIGDLPTKTYWKYFSPPRFCSPTAYYPRIYHGLARIKKWKTGYGIRFLEHAPQDDGTRCSVSVFLTHLALEQFSGRNLILATFETALDRGGNALHGYVFGPVSRNSEHPNCLDIRPDSFHSVVLMLSDQG